MKNKQIAAIICILATGCAFTSSAADDLDQAQFAQIVVQPTDQALPVGSSTVLSVQSANADGYLWFRNGVMITGQTNSILALQSVSTNDVGYYACAVLKDGEVVPTRAANVSVFTVMAAQGQITLYSTPIAGGGSSGSCPGSYAGYVSYTKTVSQGWGWTPSAGTTNHIAADGTTRSDTKIYYLGKYGDSGCNQTSVTVPDPASSPKYRFAIYFSSDVPTNSYPITLTGFDP